MKCPYAFATPYGVTGRERRRLGLRHLRRLAEDLARRRLVDADPGVDRAHRFEQRRDADSSELRGDDRLLPGDRDERRRREVVDLARCVLGEHGRERVAIEQVRLHELDPVAHCFEVRVRVARSGADDPDDVVAAVEQLLGEIRAVLACDSGDDRARRAQFSPRTYAHASRRPSARSA